MTSLRVVELSRSVAGAICGRLFSGLGHEVTLCEPVSGHPLREQEFTFTASAAGKRSVVCDPTLDTDLWHELLSSADVLITDLSAVEARDLTLDGGALATEFPRLITVSLTPFGLRGEYAEVAGDSLLAEAFGGFAHMIGEPSCSPLALGGEQAAHAAAFVGLLGASLALRKRLFTGVGDHIEVALSDVVAYMDWKSDVAFDIAGAAPTRSGSSGGSWRIVEAKDGWVGVIFLAHQWPAVVELIDDERLDDAALLDPHTRLERADELWPVIAEVIGRREAREVYVSAQRLGLPFGFAASAADLIESKQLIGRGFVIPQSERRRDAPVVAFPFPGSESGPVQRAPGLGDHNTAVRTEPTAAPRPSLAERIAVTTAPLEGVVVLDFGTITAGAATGRLLADYGATVIKIESNARPDRFRQWVMPGSGAGETTTTTSPMFRSNNVGKMGLCVDLKTDGGRRMVHELIRRADILVENFRAGVTARMGIDPDTVKRINPDLLYLSLSSQGATGPESRYASYGSTLDLLSGLASATGYRNEVPIWSSGDVNYPDQMVALAGAAAAAHGLATGRLGERMDISQRELVAWTLADQLAAHVWTGSSIQPSGNRRPGVAPHDVYPTADGGWIALACFDERHRRALATVVPGLPTTANAEWWVANQDAVDTRLTEYTAAYDRKTVIATLRTSGVPVVPVCSAADRAGDARYTERRLALRDGHGEWLKGFPMIMRGFSPAAPSPAPELAEDIPDLESSQFHAFLAVAFSGSAAHSGTP